MKKAAFRAITAAICAAALCGAADLTRYPYLQNVRADRATVMWTTLQSGRGVVQYSTDRSYSRSAEARLRVFQPSETGDVFPHYQYQAELTGLNPGIEYFYRVLLDSENLTPGDELRFRTAGAGNFNFLVFGDTGQNTNAQRQIAQRMMQENAALVLHAGDIAYSSGTYPQFQSTYFDFYGNRAPTLFGNLMRRVPFFPALGNHEYWVNGVPEQFIHNAAPAIALHAVPGDEVPAADRGRYYSFDWGNVHFIALDSNVPLRDAANGTGPMLQWLEQDLARTRKFWKIAYWHHPPYAGGQNQNDVESARAKAYIVPVLERYDVQVVFTAHEHSYQRSYTLRNNAIVPINAGTVYITTGGGGAALYDLRPHDLVEFGEKIHHYVRAEVQNARMTLRAIAIDGRLVDIFNLAPRPATPTVVNAASFTGSVAPGGLISIFGRNMAPSEAFAARLPLPTELGGASVSVNGRRAPLLYVSPTQINAQMPFDVSGSVRVTVEMANGAAESSINVSDSAPGIFFSQTPSGAVGAILHADGSAVTPSSPAAPGEVISVYLTGLGPVNGSIQAGDPTPSSPLLRCTLPAEALIGDIAVAPSFCGLAPGFAGLYQVNLRVPSLTSGMHTVRIFAAGAASNTVSIPVR